MDLTGSVLVFTFAVIGHFFEKKNEKVCECAAYVAVTFVFFLILEQCLHILIRKIYPLYWITFGYMLLCLGSIMGSLSRSL